MNDEKYKSQLFPFRNNDSYTQSSINRTKRSFDRVEDEVDFSLSEKNMLYQSINIINRRLDELQNENKRLQKDLDDTRTRENKLLNRFSWLILILNWGSVFLFVIAIILFINSLYPFLKYLIETDIGVRVAITVIGGAAGSGIIGIWLTFNKYVNKVIEREKRQ